MNESYLAELLFPHVDDSLVWCRLQCVSTRFNLVGKSKLKKIKTIGEYKTHYTELPNNKLHGLFKKWYQTHCLWTTQYYLNGKLHGLCKSWHRNGQLAEVCHFNNGVLNGLYNNWYENGQLKSSYNCSNGYYHGRRQEWSQNGQLVCDKLYYDGDHVENLID